MTVSATRTAPAPSNHPGTITDEDYSEQLRANLELLFGIGSEPVTNVAGTNTLTGDCTPTLAAYSRKYFSLKPANANTGAVTLNLGPGAKAWKDFYGNAFVSGDLNPNVTFLVYDAGTEFRHAYPIPATQTTAFPRGYISRDWKTAINVSDANNDIDFTVGAGRDSTDAVNLVGTAMTKRTDAAWAAGTNQGGMLQSANLAGTVTVTSGGSSVTGTGTAFTTDYAVGDPFTTAAGQCRRVTAVGSNTSITILGTWSSTETAVTYKRGGKARSTIFGQFAIYKDSDGTVDYAWSTRLTPVDLPTGYSKFVRLFWLLTDASANNRPYHHVGAARCVLHAGISELTGSTVGAVTSTITSSAPPDVVAELSMKLDVSTSSTIVDITIKAYATYQTGASVDPVVECIADNSVGAVSYGNSQVHIDGSSQYNFAKTTGGGLSNNYAIVLGGWTDTGR